MPAVITVSGNPSLRPETSIAVDAGYRIEFRRLSFDLSAFRYAYGNLRSLDLGAPQLQAGQQPFLVLPGTIENGNLGTSSGAELATVLELPGGSRLSASYSGLVTEIHHQPVAGGAALSPGSSETKSYTPQHQWQADWQAGLPRKVQLNLWVSHVGLIDSLGPTIQQDVPAYTRVDAQLSHGIWDGGNVQVGVQNLLTPRHIEFIPEAQAAPSEIPRSFYVRLTWRF